MRIDRLEAATSTDTMELRLHPRITVLTGLAPLHRDALTAELESVLGAGRPGLSAEFLDESGRILILERPIGGPERVIDALNGEDVTAQFRVGDTISMAGSLGIDSSDLRSYLRLGAENHRSRRSAGRPDWPTGQDRSGSPVGGGLGSGRSGSRSRFTVERTGLRG